MCLGILYKCICLDEGCRLVHCVCLQTSTCEIVILVFGVCFSGSPSPLPQAEILTIISTPNQFASSVPILEGRGLPVGTQRLLGKGQGHIAGGRGSFSYSAPHPPISQRALTLRPPDTLHPAQISPEMNFNFCSRQVAIMSPPSPQCWGGRGGKGGAGPQGCHGREQEFEFQRQL